MAPKIPHINSFPVTEKIFIDFFKTYYSSLCYFANRFLKNTTLAEDIVGDVSIKVWEKCDAIRNISALKNYFYISIRHACIRYLDEKQRKAIKNGEVLSAYYTQENTLDCMIRAEVLQEVDLALSKLPSKCRMVFTKLYIEGKSIAEAAKELQLSVSTIKSQKDRGLMILRSKLTGPGTTALLAMLLLGH